MLWTTMRGGIQDKGSNFPVDMTSPSPFSEFHFNVGTGQDRVPLDPTRSTPNQLFISIRLNDNVLNELVQKIRSGKCATVMFHIVICIWGFTISVEEIILQPPDNDDDDGQTLRVGCAWFLTTLGWILFAFQLIHIPKSMDIASSIDLKWERILFRAMILYGVIICLGLIVFHNLDFQMWHLILVMATCSIYRALDDAELIVINQFYRLNAEQNRTTLMI